ncbi:hypothetical protein ACS0TY_001356 [Phlomoides rotata]
MLKSGLFGRKKTSGGPAEFFNNWFNALATTLLPQLRRTLSSFSVSPALLSVQVEAMHHHFQSYYAALDQAAAEDVALCLCPEWRNSLERPFLWLGDLHPYLFTNLLRSFLDDTEEESEDDSSDDEVAAAWKNPSRVLTTRVDQIECGLRLMAPALAARARQAQVKFVKAVGAECGGKAAVAEAMAEEMEELVGVVVDANRLRRSVMADVLSVTTVYQAALYLEALAQFLLGFRDNKFLQEFQQCQKPINSSIF